ncbi:MAG: SpaA isopeptide-forming pilin-related protein [Myxococcota bacterium]
MRITRGTACWSWCTAAAVLLALACGDDKDGISLHVGGTAHAALAGTDFESTDGNLVVDGTKDWANAPNLTVGIDLPAGSTDDALGQGTKEDDPTPTRVFGSIPRNKSDLTRFYVATERVGTRDMLYLAWQRANVLGSANMDFEFNQSSARGSTGMVTRTPGDILITFDLVNGGSTPVLSLLKWLTIANGTAAECYASNSLPCWGHMQALSATGYADGSVNTTTVVDPIPDPDTTLTKDGSKGPRFGEAAINLSDSGIMRDGVCIRFGSVHLTSRSSASFTAEVKDFIAPVPVDINNCAPTTVILQKVDPQGNPLPGAELQLFQDDGNGTHDKADIQVGGNCITSTDGTCTYTVNSDGTYFAHELTPPNGYDVAPDTKVDITLSANPQTVVVTITDTPSAGDINIFKHDPDGKPLAGAVFTLYPDNPQTGGAPDSGDTAGTGQPTCITDKLGQCVFLNVPVGEYWVVETSPPPGYAAGEVPYQHVVIGLGSAPEQGQVVDLDFVNEFVTSAIVIQKWDTEGNALGGAVFTLYPDNPQTGGAPDSGDTAGTGHPTCVTDKLGQCVFLGVPMAQYWVVETAAPSGYATGETPYQHVVIGQGAAGEDQTVYLEFVNRRVVGAIFVQKRDSTGRACGGVEYTLYPDNPVLGGAPDSDDTAGSTHLTCVTDKLGQCMFLDVPLGEYWVLETFVPSRCSAADPSYQHASIVLGSSPGEADTVSLQF